MKIEKLNENQIRCTLTHADLAARHLKLSELAYGTEKAKSLFRDMMQQASFDFGFEAEDLPLMIEAIPSSGDSIVLIITKVEDPEELDTRFSKFSPMAEDEDSLSSLASELLEGADGLLELFAKTAGDTASSPTAGAAGLKNQESSSSDSQPSVRFFTFDSLDQVCDAARIAGQVFDGSNSLYKNPKNLRYYLIVREPETGSDSFKRICNLLSEYGSALKTDPAAEAYYQEHYEVIVKDRALQTLSKL